MPAPLAQEAAAPAQDPAARGGGRGARGGGGRGGAGGPPPETDRASALLSQAGDYIFFVHADAKGHFSIPAVRPGTYTLYAWQDQGSICQSLAVDNITIKGDKTQDLGDVAWIPLTTPTSCSRSASPTAWPVNTNSATVPAPMTSSARSQHGRFHHRQIEGSHRLVLRPNGGTWTVHFNVDKVPTGNCYLTIPIAGGGGNCALAVNGTAIGSIGKGDDSTLRRQANRAGVYARPAPIVFPASNLKQGENTLTLQGSGMMYDTVVLEAD